MDGGLGRVEDRSGEATGEIDPSRIPGSRAVGDETGLRTEQGGEVPDVGPEPDAEDGWSDEPFPDGPLHGDVLHRVVAAGTAVLATGDVYGRRDISVLSGPRCFLRVLDARTLAYPDEGEESATAVRANLAEDPRLGMMLLDRDGRRGLHLDGTARVVAADALRAEHPDLPDAPIPGRPTDVWVVVEVGDLYPLDGDDVPRLGVGRPAAAPTPERGRSRVTAVALGVLALLVLGLGALSIALALSDGGSQQAAPPPPPTPVAQAAPSGPPTLYGRVTGVVDPATVTVDVAGTPVEVAIVGLEATAVPACALPAATGFAEETLVGQQVTLVPDPTLPVEPGVTRAYAVLESQLSYTDAAILGGYVPASGPSQYRAVFDREQEQAEDDAIGMWGPPCVS